jgi:NAD dependent epimerase/dehydratase family enzyme
VPASFLRLVFGEVADIVLIHGQRVIPGRALELGFTFKYPAVDAALRAAVAG